MLPINFSEAARTAYDRVCDDWFAFRRQTSVNRCVVDFTRYLKAGGSVLDIGCGCGVPIDAYLAEQGFSVTGIDISPNMLAKARQHCPAACRFIETDFLDFIPDQTFDAVIAFDSIWHIDLAHQPALYGKVASLLDDGGYFLFTHGRTRGEISGTMFGTTFYYSALDMDGLLQTLAQSGFEVVERHEDYREATTGTRDLLMVVRKVGTSG